MSKPKKSVIEVQLNNPGFNPIEFDGIRKQAEFLIFTHRAGEDGESAIVKTLEFEGIRRGQISFAQSQGDCAPKPRVARHELPWERVG
jgi:hypothetical protein